MLLRPALTQEDPKSKVIYGLKHQGNLVGIPNEPSQLGHNQYVPS